jgi:hypothetical protein
MNNIEFSEIPRLLGPGNTTQDHILSIALYIIFFLSLVTLLMQSDKQLLATLVMAATLLLIILAKLTLAANAPFERQEFGTYVIHAGIFILPALVAGMTKAPKSRPPAVIAAVLGAIYMFGFWLLFQRF